MIKLANFVKIIGAGVVTIILGAVGSGVWERILSPGLKMLSEFTTSSLSAISQTYSDSIYQRASSIELYNRGDTSSVLLLLVIFVGMFIYGVSAKKDSPFWGGILKAIVVNVRGWPGIIYSGSFLVFISFMMATSTASMEIKSYSVKNMEILRPYIGEHEYYSLRSQYLQMESKGDFQSFLSSLYNLSNKNNVKIKEFKSK